LGTIHHWKWTDLSLDYCNFKEARTSRREATNCI
jgi:hypothetical protein